MTFTRFATRAGIVLVFAFVILVAIASHGVATTVIVALALAGLIACGNLLYGKNSHGAMAKNRTRPAQEAQDRAIDQAQEQARQRRQQQRQQQHGARRQSANQLASQFVNQFRRRPSAGPPNR
jgi:type IV secretory pathway VirB6-like protein